MKKLFSIIAVVTCLLGFTKNADAQISMPTPQITMTRLSVAPTNGLTLNIKLTKPAGSFVLSQTTSFSPSDIGTPKTISFVTGFSGVSFTVNIDGLTSASSYPLPTTVNTSTTVLSTDCGMTNYKLQYGYSVTVTCIGTNQYTIQATKLYCNPEFPCVPCGSVPN